MTSTPRILKVRYYEHPEFETRHEPIREDEEIGECPVDVDSEDEDTSENATNSEAKKERSCLIKCLDSCCGDSVRGIRDCACCLRQGTHEVYTGCRRINYKRWAKNTFNLKSLKGKFPIIKWLPKYRFNHLIGDIIAGLTVGLTQIPKSLAMAKIAYLPPQYGMYATMMCLFVYVFLGTAKDMNLGPASVLTLLVGQFGRSPIDGDPTYVLVLAFMCGLVQFVMGVFHLGFVVNYISYPVLESFTTASIITVIFGQIPNWLGLKNVPRDFLEQVYWTFKKLPETQLGDFLLGLCSIIVIYLLQKMNATKCLKPKSKTKCARVVKYLIWLFSTARNVVVVILGIVTAYLFNLSGNVPFHLTRDIPSGLPSFKPPAFSVSDGNTTYSASDMFKQMGTGIIIVPIVSYISIIAIAKSFARKGNYRVDKDQELIACGVANVVGSFFSAFPITGTFSGSSINYQSGAKTTATGIFEGILVILVLLFLTPVFYYIPDASLSAVIIMSVLDLLNFRLIIKLWHVKKIDLIPWLVTFFCCLCVGIETGILIGIAVSLCILIFPVSRPKVEAELNESELSYDSNVDSDYALLVIQQGLAFPSVEYFVNHVMRSVMEGGKTCVYRSVILDFSHVPSVDFTIVQGLEELTEDFDVMDVSLILCRVRPSVRKVLRRCGIKSLTCVEDVKEAIHLVHRDLQANGAEETLNGAIFDVLSAMERTAEDAVSIETEHHTVSTDCSSPDCSDVENSDSLSTDSNASKSTEVSHVSMNESGDFTYAF